MTRQQAESWTTSSSFEHGSRKRPHPCYLQLPLISQEEDDQMEVSPKRRRLATDVLSCNESPSIVSVMTTKSPEKTQGNNSVPSPRNAAPPTTFGSTSTTDASGMRQKTEHKSVVEWWKQKPRPVKEIRLSAAVFQSMLCFVCQCNLPTEDAVNSSDMMTTTNNTPRQSPKTVMPENALLAYFAPLTTTSQQLCLSASHETAVQESSSLSPGLCSFCERMACANCLAACEECVQVYCSFCLTTDYNETIARTVCIDCHQDTALQQTATTTHCQEEDEDAMHID